MQNESFRKAKNIFIVLFAAVLFSLPMSSNAQEQENKKLTFEVGYDASTFDDVKLSGSYGLSMTGLPWHLTDKLYAGFHFSPCYFNFGLVDSDYTSDVIKFGPALGYYFKPTVFVALPIVAVCDVHFKGTDTNRGDMSRNIHTLQVDRIFKCI